MPLPDWGSIVQAGRNAASSAYGSAVNAADKAVTVVQDTGSSAYHATVDAANYAADKAQQAADYAAEKAQQAADYAAEKAQQAATATANAGKYVGKKAVAVGVIGTEGAVGVAGAGVAVVGGAVVRQVSPVVKAGANAYKAVNGYFHPAQPVVVPCVKCLGRQSAAARAARIRKRNALIKKAMAGHDPAAKAKAAQLKSDMVAVEMARLSDNTYDQSYDDSPAKATANPPSPWKAMSDGDLRKAGIDPDLLSQSKAVVYQLPPDFPMDPKTVLAFRGTNPAEAADVLTDHDQALGLETSQYTAAKTLGGQVGKAFPDAEVTGHSLGGGKAQAAGITGNLQGMMFNSAGLNPKTMDMDADALNDYTHDFTQYRAEGGIASGDPLTALQNSPGLQTTAYGLAKGAGGVLGADTWARGQLGLAPLTDAIPEGQRQLATQFSDRLMNVTSKEAAKNYEFSGGKWYIPPAVGTLSEVPGKDPHGNPPAASDVLGRHGVKNLVNGFEYRKFNNIEALLKSTNTPGNASAYLGPTEIEMK